MNVLKRIEGTEKHLSNTSTALQLYKKSRIYVAAVAIFIPCIICVLGSLILGKYVFAAFSVVTSLSGFLISLWLINNKTQELEKQMENEPPQNDVVRLSTTVSGIAR